MFNTIRNWFHRNNRVAINTTQPEHTNAMITATQPPNDDIGVAVPGTRNVRMYGVEGRSFVDRLQAMIDEDENSLPVMLNRDANAPSASEIQEALDSYRRRHEEQDARNTSSRLNKHTRTA